MNLEELITDMISGIVEPAFYECAICGHAGGDHRLNNTCMLCDCSHFSDMTDEQKQEAIVAKMMETSAFARLAVFVDEHS